MRFFNALTSLSAHASFNAGVSLSARASLVRDSSVRASLVPASSVHSNAGRAFLAVHALA